MNKIIEALFSDRVTMRTKIAWTALSIFALLIGCVLLFVAWFAYEYASMEAYRNDIEKATLCNMTEEQRMEWLSERQRVLE